MLFVYLCQGPCASTDTRDFWTRDPPFFRVSTRDFVVACRVSRRSAAHGHKTRDNDTRECAPRRVLNTGKMARRVSSFLDEKANTDTRHTLLSLYLRAQGWELDTRLVEGYIPPIVSIEKTRVCSVSTLFLVGTIDGRTREPRERWVSTRDAWTRENRAARAPPRHSYTIRGPRPAQRVTDHTERHAPGPRAAARIGAARAARRHRVRLSARPKRRSSARAARLSHGFDRCRGRGRVGRTGGTPKIGRAREPETRR